MHTKTKTNPKLRQTIGSAINTKSTTIEPPPKYGQEPKPTGGGGGGGGGLNAFYWRQIFTQDYVFVEAQTCLARMEAS